MATRTAVVTARIEPDIKAEAEAIFDQLGLSVSEALNLFYRQVIKEKGIPFRLNLIERARRARTLKPKAFEDMTPEEVQELLDRSEEDFRNGNYYTLDEIEGEFLRRPQHAKISNNLFRTSKARS